ncbi:serine hydrolase [Aureibaculum sp. A20]|uniref:Serine hydrolase n=1 Tax=Aureibaculum flavum TaxID=2795986 RepID=A0ABS0WMS5_9FLAO|nr:serine hydrolase [Aureibaculum flavum]MBJ2173266.1 serine hydrolase [Aureibaculum flavum]
MKKLILLFLVFSVLSTVSIAQKSHKVNLKKLDQYYSKMVKDWDLPSATIGIVKDGKLVFTGSYGVKEIGKNDKPDANTNYAIASNSKAFTSAIIGMLVDEGKLNWNDKVKDYLPYFAVYDPWVSANVTIRDLLSHRVGLGTFSGDVIWYKSDLSAEEIVKRIQFIPKAYDFRAGYGYSNVMYITAGEVIRAVTGKSWAENVKERIFNPLKMERTVTNPDKLDGLRNYATPHARENNVNIPIDWVNWEEIGALGGVISNVNDISKWMILNLNNGINEKDTLFSKLTRNMVWTPHNNHMVDQTKSNDFNRHFNAYGLGWGLSDYHGNLRVGHTGGYDGMITAITMIPDKQLGVVVLTNGMKSPIMAATYYALDQFLGQETVDWSTKMLTDNNSNQKSDTRVSDRKSKRVMSTTSSVLLDDYVGTYKSDIYGNITISKLGDDLKMKFDHSPDLSATLEHWHYDVFEIKWDVKHAWFNFGTVKFNLDNNLNVQGLDFDVPNDDIFFEELKPYKVD